MSKDQPSSEREAGEAHVRLTFLERRMDAVDGDAPTTIRSRVNALEVNRAFLLGAWFIVAGLGLWAVNAVNAPLTKELAAVRALLEQRSPAEVRRQ